MAKRSKKKSNNTSKRSGHFNTLNEITRPVSGEANKTIKIAIYIFLVVATFVIYLQVQDHEFLAYDDNQFITDNLNVQAGLTKESVKWAFSTTHFVNWHPVTWLSHMLDYQLYGLHPKGHHLTNLFFHIANALLVFIIFLRMTGGLWQCGFVAAMFALHPFNVESVAWVAERRNVLSTLFWLLTMWSYIFYVERPSIQRYGMMVLFFALGLMAKPMLVTLPFVLLLMDYWPLRRLQFINEKRNEGIAKRYKDKELGVLRLVSEKIPLFLLAASSSIVTFIVQKGGGALETLDNISLPDRLNNAMISYLKYLQKMVWPNDLAAFYPHPGSTLAIWEGILCGAALVGVTAISIRLIRKAPYFVFGWLWYLGTFVPVIQIVQTGSHAMADRYTYIPLIGIFIIVAWGLPELIAKWRYKKKILSISAGIWIPMLMVLTWIQVGHWKNSITVFQHIIGVTDREYPTIAIIHNNLGAALFDEGKTEEAISHYKTAVRIDPNLSKTQSNFGNALLAKGKTEEAISHYKTAIKLNPNLAMAHYNLGNTLLGIREIEEAISHYKTAIRLKSDFAPVYFKLGNALFLERKTEEAISHYKMSVRIKPDFAQAHAHLGNALFAERKTEEAISHYKMSVRIKPDFAPTHYNLGNALFGMRKTEEAIFHYKMAIKLEPNYVQAHHNLKKALLRLRR